jgi:hypothetical protein
MSQHDHGCDEHRQKSGVNRMAHQGVRPARNQFVAPFEGHDAAPAHGFLQAERRIATLLPAFADLRRGKQLAQLMHRKRLMIRSVLFTAGWKIVIIQAQAR